MFMNGHHVVQRSESLWAGVSTDIAIKQDLMGSAKKTVVVTSRGGLTELQLEKWLLSTPACAEIKQIIFSLSGK